MPEEVLPALSPVEAFQACYQAGTMDYIRALADGLAANGKLDDAARFAFLRRFLQVQSDKKGDPGAIWAELAGEETAYLISGAQVFGGNLKTQIQRNATAEQAKIDRVLLATGALDPVVIEAEPIIGGR
jgi:hypothetical protein